VCTHAMCYAYYAKESSPTFACANSPRFGHVTSADRLAARLKGDFAAPVISCSPPPPPLCFPLAAYRDAILPRTNYYYNIKRAQRASNKYRTFYEARQELWTRKVSMRGVHVA